MSKVNAAKVQRLRLETAHCSGVPDMPEDYAKHFAAHSPDSKCLYCGGWGTFTWGLAHGSGYCVTCGWPARLYHFIKDEAKEKRIVLLLQYHPKEIILPGEKSSDEEAA